MEVICIVVQEDCCDGVDSKHTCCFYFRNCNWNNLKHGQPSFSSCEILKTTTNMDHINS